MKAEQSLSHRKISWTFIPWFQHTFVSHTLSREILGSEALWPWLLASSGLSALLQLVTLPFFPDSPSYLLIQKGNEEACRKGRVSAFLTSLPSPAVSQWEALQKLGQGRAVLFSTVPWSTGSSTHSSSATHGSGCAHLGLTQLLSAHEDKKHRCISACPTLVGTAWLL